MHENAISRIVYELCNTCTTRSCVGPYDNPCGEFLDKYEEETKQCKTCKYDGQICSGKSCKEGTESTKVSWTWDESKKALIDICEALCGFEESDLVELKPKEIARRIFLKIYYSENLLSFAKGEPESERDKTDEGFLEFVTDKGYDISKEQLEKLRREASVCAAIETVEVAPVRHGRWVLLPNRTAPSKLFKCSECGNVTEHEYFSRNGYYPFCKDCGAKMDGTDGGEEI
jgi:hypothetical protein